MRSILEELFYGNICPNTDCRSRDKETKQLMGYIADHHDNLLSTLNDQQKEVLEKFDDCYNELTSEQVQYSHSGHVHKTLTIHQNTSV